jgi:hypothetical protein
MANLTETERRSAQIALARADGALDVANAALDVLSTLARQIDADVIDRAIADPSFEKTRDAHHEALLSATEALYALANVFEFERSSLDSTASVEDACRAEARERDIVALF